jgi:hypothetical protein
MSHALTISTIHFNRCETPQYYAGIRLGGLRKTTENFNQHSCSSGPRFKPEPPEYEAGALTTLTRRSVPFCNTTSILMFKTTNTIQLRKYNIVPHEHGPEGPKQLVVNNKE